MASKKDSELNIKSTIVNDDLFRLLDSQTTNLVEKNKTVSLTTLRAALAGTKSVNPGPNFSTTVTEPFLLDGSLSKGDIIAYAWSKISGPSLSWLSNDDAPTVLAKPTTTGTYVFRLIVSYSDTTSANAEVTVTVI